LFEELGAQPSEQTRQLFERLSVLRKGPPRLSHHPTLRLGPDAVSAIAVQRRLVAQSGTPIGGQIGSPQPTPAQVGARIRPAHAGRTRRPSSDRSPPPVGWVM